MTDLFILKGDERRRRRALASSCHPRCHQNEKNMASAREDRPPLAEEGSSVFGRFRHAALAGLLGTTLVSVAASLPGAPFALKVPGAWFFGTPSLSQFAGVDQ